MTGRKNKNGSFTSNASGGRGQGRARTRSQTEAEEGEGNKDDRENLLMKMVQMQENCDKLAEIISEMNQKHKDIVITLKEPIEAQSERLDSLEGRITKIEKKQEVASKLINTEVTKIGETKLLTQEIKEANKQNQKTINKLELTFQKANNQNQKMTSKLGLTLERMQRGSKENNIIIKGLKATNNNNNEINSFLTKTLKADPQKIKIKETKIYNKNNTVKISAILSLSSKEEKSYLFSFAKNLKNTGYSMADDLTPNQIETRNQLLIKRRELIDNGVATNIKVFDSALKVDGQWYVLSNLGELVKRKPKKPQDPSQENSP